MKCGLFYTVLVLGIFLPAGCYRSSALDDDSADSAPDSVTVDSAGELSDKGFPDSGSDFQPDGDSETDTCGDVEYSILPEGPVECVMEQVDFSGDGSVDPVFYYDADGTLARMEQENGDGRLIFFV